MAALQTAIETDLKANVYVQHKGDKIDKVRSYLASIFDFSHTSTQEQWLLKQMVCLPSEYYTYPTLEELINPAASERTDLFPETLEELADKGWLLHNPDTDTYKMHRIIAEVASQKLPLTLAEVEPLIEMVTKKLSLDQNKGTPIDGFPWISFGKAILVHFSEEVAIIITVLQNNLAIILKNLGDYEGARSLLEKAVALVEQNFKENHFLKIKYYSNLALVLQDLGKFTEAKNLLEKAVFLEEQDSKTINPFISIRYSNLANVLKDLGQLKSAKKLLEKAVASDLQNFGANDPRTAISYSNLALVLQSLGKNKKAKQLLEKIVNLDEKNFGINDPRTAINYSNLALVYADLKILQQLLFY